LSDSRGRAAHYSFGEELLHALTHGVGVILSIIGLSWMLYVSIGLEDPWRVTASLVYGVSLITLFLASTLYHAWPESPRKHWLKLLDHCAIYFLIAGTYTPFVLVAMRSNTGWWLFGAIWALATAGILTKLVFRHRYPRLSLASYLAMGWLAVLAAPEMAEAVTRGGMNWVVAGGLCYTIGALFYVARRMPYNHAVWHVFVVLGSVCHFLAVIWYVLPAQPLPGVTAG
jgi:hemolysin III